MGFGKEAWEWKPGCDVVVALRRFLGLRLYIRKKNVYVVVGRSVRSLEISLRSLPISTCLLQSPFHTCSKSQNTSHACQKNSHQTSNTPLE